MSESKYESLRRLEVLLEGVSSATLLNVFGDQQKRLNSVAQKAGGTNELDITSPGGPNIPLPPQPQMDFLKGRGPDLTSLNNYLQSLGGTSEALYASILHSVADDLNQKLLAASYPKGPTTPSSTSTSQDCCNTLSSYFVRLIHQVASIDDLLHQTNLTGGASTLSSLPPLSNKPKQKVQSRWQRFSNWAMGDNSFANLNPLAKFGKGMRRFSRSIRGMGARMIRAGGAASRTAARGSATAGLGRNLALAGRAAIAVGKLNTMAGVVIGVTGTLLGFGQAVAGATSKLQRWNDELMNTMFKTGETSPSMQMVKAQYQVERMLLSIERGERNAGHASALAKVQMELARRTAPAEDAWNMLKSMVQAGLTLWFYDMLSKIGFVDWMNKILDKIEKAAGVQQNQLLEQMKPENVFGAIGAKQWWNQNGRPGRFGPKFP